MGFFHLICRLTCFISIAIQNYSVLSRQEDLESSFALCKVLGLTLFPVTFLLILFCVIGVANGQPKTYLPPALFLVLFSSVLMPIGIIVTNDNTRSYSEDRILICFNAMHTNSIHYFEKDF